MTSWRRFLLAVSVVLLLAAPAFAGITLVSPRAGERLEGGTDATLTWAADALPPGVHEWEAFLSIDGGGYYAVRITPHLSDAVRSVTWRVPNVTTSRACLMLRIGDEKNERILALPQTFAIEPSPAPLELASPESEAGEPATPDGDPAVEWVSSDYVTHRYTEPSASSEPRFAPSRVVDACCTQAPVARADVRRSRIETQVHDARQTARAIVVLRPLLLLTSRLNI